MAFQDSWGTFLCQVWWSLLHRFLRYRVDKLTRINSTHAGDTVGVWWIFTNSNYLLYLIWQFCIFCVCPRYKTVLNWTHGYNILFCLVLHWHSVWYLFLILVEKTIYLFCAHTYRFYFYPRDADAMLARVLAVIVCLCVCLSVCLSVWLLCRTQYHEHDIYCQTAAGKLSWAAARTMPCSSI